MKADIDRTLPIVSIMGRPNVGKSTLFNRLIGTRRAITDPTPGVTRDPIPGRWLVGNNAVTLVDSGGVKVERTDMDKMVADKALSLPEISDVIILVMDVTDVNAEDEALLESMRPYTDKLILAVNKVDDYRREDSVWNFFSYGYPRIVALSSAHGSGIEELEDEVLGLLNLERTEDVPESSEDIRLAILGKPNTGKSTLINLLTGRDISIVSSIPGTTRDVMTGSFTFKNRIFTVLDTAGIRRKSKVDDDIEYYSVNRAIKTIDEADAVLLMVSVDEGLSEQDKKIANLVVRRGKGIIIVLNKEDLLKGVKNEKEAIKDRVNFLFPILSFAPICFISALNGTGIDKLLNTVLRVHSQYSKRIDTSVLNRALKQWVKEHEPPRGSSGYYKVLYGTQVSSSPVRFLFFVNRVSAFPDTYISYLKNKIRKDFGFENVPVDISLRERERTENLNKKGPKTDIVLPKKVSKTGRKKGIARKPGGRARTGKAIERAERNRKNGMGKRKGN